MKLIFEKLTGRDLLLVQIEILNGLLRPFWFRLPITKKEIEMSVKKVILSLVVLGIFAAFMAVPFSTVEAGERPIPGPTPMDNPPECVPINFPVEGYWGIYCADQDNDIVSATIVTNNNYTLNWDNTYAQFIVELDSDTTELFSSDPTISWSVCDSYGNCVGGTYQ